MAENTKGIGTKKTGFAPSHYGPFRCGNCIWLRPGETCAHPEVNADPQVEKDAQGHAKVEKDACCNEFRPQELNLGGMIRKAVEGKK